MSGAVTEAAAAMTGLVGLQLHRAVPRWSRKVPRCCFYHEIDSLVLQSQVEVLFGRHHLHEVLGASAEQRQPLLTQQILAEGLSQSCDGSLAAQQGRLVCCPEMTSVVAAGAVAVTADVRIAAVAAVSAAAAAGAVAALVTAAAAAENLTAEVVAMGGEV